ncbi:MAG: 8-amino-7-oxononanoate synthase, partial [Muribaculaceae bacterium]|nr:8-amino-7-oxononanoate synthase [Muribaculaceae bacterium]
MENKFEAYKEILKNYESENRLRAIPSDRRYTDNIDLSENDYLGLGKRYKEFLADFYDDNEESFTSSASRLLAGNQKCNNELEKMLQELYGKPALLFNSGYHANVGTVSALNIPGTIFLCDKLIHASVIDGVSMSKAPKDRWRHNDINHLHKLLEKYNEEYDRIIVVAESIYSMDGDLAPLEKLVELKLEFPKMILYLDEAHAFGVRGAKGLGVAEEYGCLEEVDILVGTLGKAAASSGAFVITSPLLKSYLVNCARSFIFSTAIAPINVCWTIEMIKRIKNMSAEREYLSKISKDFRNFITKITGKENPSSSQIIPLMIGDAAKAIRIADLLREEGIDALPIRRPTVPPGGERIRFSLNASLSLEDIE